MTQNERDLTDEVKRWVSTQGYPIEMRVARAFRKVELLRVRHAPHFTDPKEKKSRELDLIVGWRQNFDGRIIQVMFAIECKYSKHRPWVIFSDRSIKFNHDQNLQQRVASFFGRKLLGSPDLINSIPGIVEPGLFQVAARYGYRVTAALIKSGSSEKSGPGTTKQPVQGSGSDIAYTALSSVSAAANAIARALDQSPIAAIIFPVVVVEGRLFDCHLASNGDLAVEEIRSGQVVWRQPEMSPPSTVVHVVTMEDLDALVDAALDTVKPFVGLNTSIIAPILGRPGGKLNIDDPRIDFF